MTELCDTSIISSPTPKRKRISPSLLDPDEDTKPPEESGFFYFSRNQLLGAQIAEVDAHSYNVEHGTCWQEMYPANASLEPSAMALGDLPPETLKLLTWSGKDKASFIELIGRKTASALPEISRILGKSFLECQIYLDMLQQASEDLAIDYAEIPAAEEVPEKLVEPDLDLPDLKRQKLDPAELKQFDDKDDSQRYLLSRKRLGSIHNHTDAAFVAKMIQNALRMKVSEWIEACFRQVLTTNNNTITDDIVEFVVGGCQTPIDEHEEEENEDEDNEIGIEEEERLDNLIDKETQWLDQLDAFGSTISLHMRGLVLRSEIGPPPEIRDQDLEKFMQSR